MAGTLTVGLTSVTAGERSLILDDHGRRLGIIQQDANQRTWVRDSDPGTPILSNADSLRFSPLMLSAARG